MSKYNLIDIYEQYQIGSGWTRDFDYDGMLKAGLKTGVDTDIELLKKMAEDYTDVNYHREASHLYNAIEALEENAIKEASMFFGDFHAEIEETMKSQGMDIEPTLGKFMASKMEENTEAVDLAIETSQEKAGIKEAREYAPMDRDVANRIEGFLNIPMKKKFLDAWEDLFYDLVDDEPFYVDDVIAHLANEMSKSIHGNQMAGDRLAGIGVIDDFEQEEFTAIPEENSIEEGSTPSTKDIVKALKAANAQDSEIKQYMASVKRAGDKFDDVDDYVEDFNEYVANKGLEEHFKRFM
jgi:hypothetical protein